MSDWQFLLWRQKFQLRRLVRRNRVRRNVRGVSQGYRHLGRWRWSVLLLRMSRHFQWLLDDADASVYADSDSVKDNEVNGGQQLQITWRIPTCGSWAECCRGNLETFSSEMCYGSWELWVCLSKLQCSTSIMDVGGWKQKMTGNRKFLDYLFPDVCVRGRMPRWVAS